VRFRSPVKTPPQRSVLARVAVGALLGGSVIAAAAAIAVSLGLWPGGKDHNGSAQSKASPGESALAVPESARPSARADRREKKPRRKHRTVLVASDVQVMGAQGLVLPEPPAASTAPAEDTVSVAPKPQRPPAKRPAAKRPAAKHPAGPALSTGLPLPASSAAQPTADGATRLVRLSVQSVAVAPNDANKPELLVKMGINGAQPGDAVPDTVTLHLLPQVPASVPKDDPTLALTARVDMVEAPRSAPTDPALRMRVRMAIAPVQTGTPMVQEPGPGDGRSNVIALTVGLSSFSDTPDGGTPGGPSDPDEPAPVDPAPEQPGSGGPGPEQPAPVEPAPEQPAPVDPAPEQPAPVDPAPEQPTGGTPAPTPAPLTPIELLIPIGPERPNSGSTIVPISPAAGAPAPAVNPIPVDVVLEELPPDELPPDAIPVDVVLEELPPYDPPADPSTVPTPVTEEPPVDVPAAPSDSDPGPAPDPSAASVGAVAVSAPAGADAAAYDTDS
jgi:hypothetical protein